MTDLQKKEAAREKRETAIQVLRIASYSVSLLVMLVVLFMMVTQAGIMRHVSQTMEDATQSISEASDFGDGGESTFGD